jgi:hypothetical protein
MATLLGVTSPLRLATGQLGNSGLIVKYSPLNGLDLNLHILAG